MSNSVSIETPDRSVPREYQPQLVELADRLKSAGISLAVLFGSRARGEEHRGSDMDVGLLAGDGRPLSYAAMGSLGAELSRMFSREVDVSDLATPDAIFRYEVVRTARILFESRPYAFADFLARTLIDYDDIRRFIPELVAGVARRARRSDSSSGGAQH